MNIYYNKDDEKANRGVKYANGALGEANDMYFPFGLLVEVAHHDYKEDALWIMRNNIFNEMMDDCRYFKFYLVMRDVMSLDKRDK